MAMEIVERVDGLFDVVHNGNIVREAIFLNQAYAFTRGACEPGYITLILNGTVRITL